MTNIFSAKLNDRFPGAADGLPPEKFQASASMVEFPLNS
jgi:hypothetical protein